MNNIKISTYITTYNALFYQSTLEQTIRQSLLFSDEIIVVNSEHSTDGSQNLLNDLQNEYPNIIKLYTFKEDFSNNKNWNTVAEKKSFALSKCTGDYCILQDDDECIHEKYIEYIKQFPKIYPETTAFRFNTIHFYRSYYHYQISDKWYQKKIYMVKNMPEIYHGKVNNDIDNHIIKLPINNTIQHVPLDSLEKFNKCKIINTPITSYHYGWCRNDAILLMKKYQQEIQWWGNDYWNKIEHKFPFKFDNPENLPEFNESHPKYMIPIIDQEKKYNSKHIKEFTC